MSKRVQGSTTPPKKPADNKPTNKTSTPVKKPVDNKPNNNSSTPVKKPADTKSNNNSSTNIKKTEQSPIKTNDSMIMQDNNNVNQSESPYSFKNSNNKPLIPTQEYINNTIGEALTEGMFQVSQTKPSNPIEFLGRYLLDQSKLRKQKR